MANLNLVANKTIIMLMLTQRDSISIGDGVAVLPASYLHAARALAGDGKIRRIETHSGARGRREVYEAVKPTVSSWKESEDE